MPNASPGAGRGPANIVQGRRSRGHHHFRAASRKSLLISLAIVAVFLVVEAIGGWLTNSLALLADAAHLLTDFWAIVLALLAIWLAARPISSGRTFGYHRAEIFAAFANGVVLWGVAGYIAYEAFHRVQDPPQVDALPMVLVAFLGFIAQSAAAFVEHKGSGESLNVRGAYVHVATDAIQSLGVVVAGILMLAFRWYLADPVISFVIVGLIVFSGSRVAWDASKILMESSPAGIDIDALCQRLERIEGVEGVHDIHAWTITTGYNVLSAHATYDPAISRDPEDLLREMRGIADHEFGISHVTIQLEDSATSCMEEGHHVSHP